MEEFAAPASLLSFKNPREDVQLLDRVRAIPASVIESGLQLEGRKEPVLTLHDASQRDEPPNDRADLLWPCVGPTMRPVECHDLVDISPFSRANDP
jgi:hypothetical protein